MFKLTYEELEQERNQLAAQVERLLTAYDKMHDWYELGKSAESLDAMYEWESVRDETPPAALVALKAEYMAQGVEAAIVDYRREYIGQGVEKLLQSFADSIRQRAQEAGDE